jgi:hypothetical protein
MVLQGNGDQGIGKERQSQPAEVQPAQPQSQAQASPPAEVVKEVHLTPADWHRMEVMMHWACRTHHIKLSDQTLCSKQCQSCTVLTLEDWLAWSTSCAHWMIKQEVLGKKGFR